jgi:cell division protein FtsQ
MLQRLKQAQAALAPLGLKPARIRLSDRRAWTIELDDGLEVILGRTDFDLRLERFAQLVPAALGERLREAGQLDMRYTNGFAVRWRSGAAAAADGGAMSSWASDPTRT